MDWTEIKITVDADNVDRAGDIAQMVVPYGIYIEDYRTLEQEAWEIARIDLIDEDLQAAGLKIVVKPDQLQRGAVHVRDRKRLLLIARGLIEDLQIEFLHQLAELGRVASDFFHIFPHNPAEVSRRRVNLVAIILLHYSLCPAFSQYPQPCANFFLFLCK